MEGGLSYLGIIVILGTVLGIFEQQCSVTVVYRSHGKLTVSVNVLVCIK